MESLKELNDERCKRLGTTGKRGTQIASREMCTFLIVNISSLQLIPVNMIAFRSQYGSVNPTAIVGPAIIATFVSTVVGVIFAKMMSKRKDR
jgi:spore maturation protein A